MRCRYGPDAILGNVEAGLDSPADDAGCGCAYPASVDGGVVARSNRIHARLKATARRHADLLARIAQLPMVARYRIADCRIGVVHGDAESLAGRRFDVTALDDPSQVPWLKTMFDAADVDLFASTHDDRGPGGPPHADPYMELTISRMASKVRGKGCLWTTKVRRTP